MKNFLLLIIGISLLKASAQQGPARLQNGQSYAELPNPAATNEAEWAALGKEVTVSFVNSNARYAKEKVPQLAVQTNWQASAWKGEEIHTLQLKTGLAIFLKKNTCCHL